MIIYLDIDEWYPVFYIAEPHYPGAVAVEVSEETLDRWKQARSAFVLVQSEMRNLSDEAWAKL